ncbi:Nicotinate dehydrogenase small FeS subunit [Candidatus Calditenuaceae archaeon HR02]|nr:Nicotinate dehydrogenase small FeS subunit [Candidatus Calditenuaceae archaeon HR02]
MRIRFRLDGQSVEVDVKHTETLLRVLKDRLGVGSVHFGCGEGSCGACIVLIDGRPRYSCLTLAGYVDGKEVSTVAALARDGELTEIQKAFVENNAAQCGYCTPGMILIVRALLEKNPSPSDEELFDALAGNLCRCTGYVPIINAIRSVIKR